jgi:hypothetical protein
MELMYYTKELPNMPNKCSLCVDCKTVNSSVSSLDNYCNRSDYSTTLGLVEQHYNKQNGYESNNGTVAIFPSQKQTQLQIQLNDCLSSVEPSLGRENKRDKQKRNESTSTARLHLKSILAEEIDACLNCCPDKYNNRLMKIVEQAIHWSLVNGESARPYQRAHSKKNE